MKFIGMFNPEKRPSLRSARHLEQTGDRSYKRWIYIGSTIILFIPVYKIIRI